MSRDSFFVLSPPRRRRPSPRRSSAASPLTTPHRRVTELSERARLDTPAAGDYTASGFQRMTPPDPARWRALCLRCPRAVLDPERRAALGTLPGDVAVRALVRGRISGPRPAPLFHGVNRGGTWLVLLPATALLFALSAHARRRWWLWCAVLRLAPVIQDGWKVLVGRTRPEDRPSASRAGTRPPPPPMW